MFTKIKIIRLISVTSQIALQLRSDPTPLICLIAKRENVS